MNPTTADLAELYRTLALRHGEDHPLTKRALSDARHAGVVIAPHVLMGTIPEDDIRAYRGMVGEAVGNRAVVRDDIMTTRAKIHAARRAARIAAAGLVVTLALLVS